MSTDLKQHPLSAAFPSMSPADQSALTDDIAANGLRHAIVLHEGMVLDGWHRLQGCIACGEKPRFETYDGADPVAFVLSLNLARRHLTASQRAAAVVACADWKPSGRPVVSEKGDPGSPFQTNEAMAASAEVDVRTVQRAKKAHAAGLGDAVRDGKVSAKTAAAVADLPAKERAKVVEQPPEDWVDALQRKKPAPAEELEHEEEGDERLADLARDFEAAIRIIESDDKVAAAWLEVKTLTTKLEELNRLYDAKCAELAAMTKEAKRWQRKAERGAA